jgi:hypothetical protein
MRACYAAIPRPSALQVLLPAAAGVAVLAAGGGGASVPMFLVAGLLGFVFYLYRQQLALVGRLLSVASHALVDNPSIVGGSLLLQAGGEPAGWWRGRSAVAVGCHRSSCIPIISLHE